MRKRKLGKLIKVVIWYNWLSDQLCVNSTRIIPIPMVWEGKGRLPIPMLWLGGILHCWKFWKFTPQTKIVDVGWYELSVGWSIGRGVF